MPAASSSLPLVVTGPTDSGPSSVLLTIAYEGGPFSGWALQPKARTVAGEVLGAIRSVDPTVTELRGASRTDAGVHARGQLAAFDPGLSIPSKGWALALSAHLPREIAVRRASLAPRGAEPRHEAIWKCYRYLILRDAVRDPFWEGRALRWTGPFDLDLARREAEMLLGTHDFAAFRSASDERTNTVRTLLRATVSERPTDTRFLEVEVVGTGFMHNMVRIIAGTLLDVARGRLAPRAVERALGSGQRSMLGMTAPAAGLYLEHIEHRIPVTESWPPG